MKKITSKFKYLYIFAFLLVVFASMTSIIGKTVQNKAAALLDKEGTTESSTDAGDLEGTISVLAASSSSSEQGEEVPLSLLVSLYKNYLDTESRIENKAASGFELYRAGIVLGRYVQKFMGLSVSTALGINDTMKADDIVVNLGEEYLAYVLDADLSETVDERLDSVLSFSEYLREQEIPLLVVEAPMKMDDSLYEYEEVYSDQTTEFTLKIAQTLRDGGVSVLSIDEEIEAEHLDKIPLFFKTDHHWLPQTGIWACQKLCECLNQEFGYSLDAALYDIDNYDVSYIYRYFLGSQGRKVTTAYCRKEDFPVIMPLYDTNFTVYNSGTGTTTTGTVQETLLDAEKINLKGRSIYDIDAYGYYGYGDQALIQIHNEDVNDGSHILVIKESMADCMYPYLAAAVEYLDVIDLRYFEGSLKEYMEETEPDTVVIIYGVLGFLYTDDAFDFE